jgi:hypothetical protein
MITKKTVFVLGAGASMPYGFPSGAELRKMLCVPATKDFSTRAVDWVTPLEKNGISERDSIRFAESFLKSRVVSIDSFLSRRSTDFGEIGKTAIAAIICAFEEPAALHKIDNEDDWYGYLWNALISGIHKCDELGRNQVSFITFNYDRSLEYFLLQSCKETFGVSHQEAVKALEPIKIIHVYGQLGLLDFDGAYQARAYETRIGARDLSIASSGIKIIPEARDDAPEFVAAREFCGQAEQICFLGFGFDPLNVSRLNLEPEISIRRISGTPIRIAASMYKKTPAEQNAIKNAIPSSSGYWDMHYRGNLDTLRNSGVLL